MSFSHYSFSATTTVINSQIKNPIHYTEFIARAGPPKNLGGGGAWQNFARHQLGKGGLRFEIIKLFCGHKGGKPGWRGGLLPPLDSPLYRSMFTCKILIS